MTTSRTHARTRLLALATGFAGASVAAYIVATERVRADRVEHTETLPGDDLIPSPIGSLTNAITIHRPPRDVWPWLAQMGAGSRGGWYSYDAIDNGGRPSASGALWILPAIGFVAAALGLLEGWNWWSVALLAATIVSTLLTVLDRNVAFMGAIVDFAIVGAVLWFRLRVPS